MKSSGKTQVALVVDDHPVVRRGLADILMSRIGLTVMEAGSIEEGLRRLAQSPVSLLVLDLSLEDSSGLDSLKEIHKRYPAVPILVHSMFPERTYAARALRAGASGYVAKSASEEQLESAMRTLLDGKRCISEQTAQDLLDDRGSEAPHRALTDREFEVFQLLAAGHPVSRTAEILGLSVKTVSSHRTRILDKMGLDTNYDLIRYGFEHNLSGA